MYYSIYPQRNHNCIFVVSPVIYLGIPVNCMYGRPPLPISTILAPHSHRHACLARSSTAPSPTMSQVIKCRGGGGGARRENSAPRRGMGPRPPPVAREGLYVPRPPPMSITRLPCAATDAAIIVAAVEPLIPVRFAVILPRTSLFSPTLALFPGIGD